MARISTYDKDVSLSGKDKVVGSNYISTINQVDQYVTNNFTLKDLSDYFAGQIIIDPQLLSLKTQGGLVYETVNDTNFLAVNLSHTNITGQLANSDLVNSYITINGTNVQLGGSINIPIGDITAVTAGTYLNGGGETGDVTLNHDLTTRTDTTSSITPAHETSFTVIDTLSTNSTGHITGANTKTVTLPSDTTYTIEAIDSSNDALIRLIGSNSTTDDIKLKAGSNIVINVNESTDEIEIAGTAFGNVYTVNSEAAMIAATSTAGDLVVRTDVSKTFIHNGGTTGTVADFTELQFSGIQQIDLVAGDGIDLEDHASNPITTLTQSANDLKVINTLATSSERGGIQIGYTENGKNYPVELSSEKAYVNVPWVDTDTTYTAGAGLNLVGTEFSHTDTSSVTNLTFTSRTYVDALTFDTYGHVTGYSTSTETVTDTNDYVDSITVTGSGTKTITIGRTGALADLTATFTDNDTTYTTATSSVLGLVKIGYTENGKNYPVELSSGQMFVNVPWTDNNTTYTAGTGLTLSGTTFNANVDGTQTTAANASTTTANRTYKVQVDSSDNLVVNVPWVDTDINTTNWNFRADSNTPENISAGETLTFASGTNVSLGQSGNTITISSTDTDTNNYVTGASVSGTATKTLTLTRQGLSDLTATWTDIDTNTDNYVDSVTVTGSATKTITIGRTGSLPDLTASWTDIDTNTDNYVTGASVTGTATKTLTLTRSGGLSNITATWTDLDTNTDTNYYLNTASFNTGNGVLSLGVTGYGTVTVDLDGRYLTSYSETSTLANVVSRGNSTNGTLEVTGSGAWLTVEGNTGGTTPPLNYGLGFGWNRSNGSNETEILFRSSSAGHNGSLRIVSFDGSTYRTLTKMYGNEAIEFTNAGNITAEHQSTRYLRRAYDSSRYAQLESNSSGGALYMQHVGNSIYLRSYNNCYINPLGNLGIGNTSPSSSYKLDVSGTIRATGDVIAYSDKRVKENIKTIDNALEKVNQLRGVEFNKIGEDKKSIGVIAQEVEKILPQVISTDDKDMKSVAYGNIVGILIEAIKELSDRIKVLEDGSTK